jgi:hypothetical protein
MSDFIEYDKDDIVEDDKEEIKEQLVESLVKDDLVKDDIEVVEKYDEEEAEEQLVEPLIQDDVEVAGQQEKPVRFVKIHADKPIPKEASLRNVPPTLVDKKFHAGPSSRNITHKIKE